MLSGYYTAAFYEQLRDGARKSAEVIVPMVLQLLPVRSVVDVGCGDGTWLAIFRKLGVDEMVGIDGEYVGRKFLQIPEGCFKPFDLADPFSLDRTFDLAVSLEVAEHLPPESAATFVESLTRLAPSVLFSAAIPFQGGTNHLNEQWPDKWAELFRDHGFFPVDFIRKRVWQNDAVEWWYAQNTILYVQANLIDGNNALRAELEQTSPGQLCLVHPKQFLQIRSQHLLLAPGVRAASRHLLSCLGDAVKWRLNSVMKRKSAQQSDVADLNSTHKR